MSKFTFQCYVYEIMLITTLGVKSKYDVIFNEILLDRQV